METFLAEDDTEIVTFALPLYRGKAPAASANLVEIYNLAGLLFRSSTVLRLMYYHDDPVLEDIRAIVRSKGVLTDEILADAASRFPPDFISLKAESPLTWIIKCAQEVASAIDILAQVPANVYKGWIGVKRERHEFEQQILEDERKNRSLLVSPLALSEALRGLEYDVPEALIEAILQNKAQTQNLIELAHNIEKLKQERAVTIYMHAKAMKELSNLPGFQKAFSVISEDELMTYNTELMRNSVINQVSDLHFHTPLLEERPQNHK